ncbi:hypothetical protein SK128_017962, partial [Halocaridina rubra]
SGAMEPGSSGLLENDCRDLYKDQNGDSVCDNKEKLACQICERLFTTKSNLKRHIRRHTGEKPFSCPECDCKFTWRDALISHQRLHSGEKPYNCDICQKSFRSKPNLLSHRKVHTGDRPYVCEVCGKTYTQNCHLKVHKRLHATEIPFRCQQCGMKFHEAEALHRHSEVNKDINICRICDKKFCGAQSFELHMKFHAGIKEYECKDCGSTFHWKGSLHRHLRQSEYSSRAKCRNVTKCKEKGYECDVCNKKFATKAIIRTHINKHNGIKPFECPECGNKFTARSSLKQHMKLNCKGKAELQKPESILENELDSSNNVSPVPRLISFEETQSSDALSDFVEMSSPLGLSRSKMSNVALPLELLPPPVEKVEDLTKDLSLKDNPAPSGRCRLRGLYEINTQRLHGMFPRVDAGVPTLSTCQVDGCSDKMVLDVKEEIEIIEEDVEPSCGFP